MLELAQQLQARGTQHYPWLRRFHPYACAGWRLQASSWGAFPSCALPWSLRRPPPLLLLHHLLQGSGQFGNGIQACPHKGGEARLDRRQQRVRVAKSGACAGQLPSHCSGNCLGRYRQSLLLMLL